MEILVISITVILPLLIGFILGKTRDNKKIVFNKKLEIYSDIVYHLSSVKHLQLNLDISVEKLKTLTKKMDSLQENETSKLKPHSINNKLEEVDKKTRILNYRDELIKLFAPARLIGSVAVVEELREYFSLISEYFSLEEKEDIYELSNKISKSVMELEQLMRKDLGHFRLLSKWDIRGHLHKK